MLRVDIPEYLLHSALRDVDEDGVFMHVGQLLKKGDDPVINILGERPA